MRTKEGHGDDRLFRACLALAAPGTQKGWTERMVHFGRVERFAVKGRRWEVLYSITAEECEGASARVMVTPRPKGSDEPARGIRPEDARFIRRIERKMRRMGYASSIREAHPPQGVLEGIRFDKALESARGVRREAGILLGLSLAGG